MTGTIYGLLDAADMDCEIRYVGKTISPILARINNHKAGARRGDDWASARWIRKIGPERVRFTIIESGVELDVLSDREIFWIRELNTYKSSRGLNSTPGGDGPAWTDESRAKASASKFGVKWDLSRRLEHSRMTKDSGRFESENNPNATISNEVARAIYLDAKSRNGTHAEIAERFGVKKRLVDRVSARSGYRAATASLVD